MSFQFCEPYIIKLIEYIQVTLSSKGVDENVISAHVVNYSELLNRANFEKYVCLLNQFVICDPKDDKKITIDFEALREYKHSLKSIMNTIPGIDSERKERLFIVMNYNGWNEEEELKLRRYMELFVNSTRMTV